MFVCVGERVCVCVIACMFVYVIAYVRTHECVGLCL